MLENLKKTRSAYHTCKVELLLPTLEDKDKTALLGYLEQDDFGPQSLHNALFKVGVFLPAKSIEKHRNKVCSCFRD